MTRDDIIRMAQEAFSVMHIPKEDVPRLERFAAIVAAAEREACAKACEGRIGGAIKQDAWWSGFKVAMIQCAEVIRARGNTK